LPRLNILHLADFRWYNATAHYALTVAQALSQKGHNVFLGLASARNLPALGGPFGKLQIFNLDYNMYDPASMVRSATVMSKLIQSARIQIVNVHTAGFHVWVALAKKLKNMEVKLVRTRGEAYPPKRNPFNMYLYSGLTDQIIVPARILAERYAEELGVECEKINHIPLGIRYFSMSDQRKVQAWKEKLGMKPEEKIVGMVGRLSPVKGHVYFIQSAELVLDKDPLTKFIIAGQDAQISQARLKRIAYRLGVLDRFVFLGKVREIEQLTSIFDLGVICSVGSETICRVLQEFMAAGKPVIGTRVNGIPDFIEPQKNGYLVEPADSQQLACAITRLLNDAELRERMGNYSRTIIQNEYSLEKFAERTLEVYLKLLEK